MKEKIEELIKQGKSVTAIAQELKTTIYMLEKYMKAHGIEKPVYNQTTLSKEQREFIKEYATGRTAIELSQLIYGDTDKENIERIRRHLERNGIPYKKRGHGGFEMKQPPKMIVRPEEKQPFVRRIDTYSNPQWNEMYL